MDSFKNVFLCRRGERIIRHDAKIGSALPIRMSDIEHNVSVEVKDGRRLLVEEPVYGSLEECKAACAKFNKNGQIIDPTLTEAATE